MSVAAGLQVVQALLDEVIAACGIKHVGDHRAFGVFDQRSSGW
jgi:hypothetical protein